MTPVEERIDHAQIAKRLTTWANARERRNGPDGHGQTGTQLLRDAAALLTEHSARKHPLGCEACMVEIRKAVARGVTYLDNSMLCSDALPATESAQPKCSGYCIGTRNVETLVEDLTCPIHGIEAQKRAKDTYPDRQAWLDALAESAQPEEGRQ